ncbi:MAG TPA: nuclear transport factor 2 family protein [Methanoregulaceae archaeon]|nr:nuclear transport factor 2 family protein [Methanoregulaceae archaeon]HPD75180.1 nuclear transport factor 2 family protein [Methanoregulaceae archaeon]
MTLNQEKTAEILSVIDDYVRFYNEKSESKVLALFSKTVSGFGTGRDEVVEDFRQLKGRIHADLDPANAIRLSVRVIATGGEMPAAWVTAFCNLYGMIGKKPIHLEGRMTAVLVNRGGRWLFEQIHFSAPDA